ncbi:deleted in malignant brain tumors 1 protein-like [Silurus asotus]|uniref:Deleted in malignant brain tumors 1 protein-like n=1 Tax=Silurus asotus TaxID=30991 RepID=A0AAD5B182_SILAS|nr:deleted in malignant brain tumors 1 protein-like [Silurus asotus]
MALLKLTVLCSVVCVAVFDVRLVESQTPTLVFDSSVNQSAIKLYEAVKVLCTIPDRARKPAEVHLSFSNAINESFLSFKLWIYTTVIFTLGIKPEHETSFVCWYTDTQSNEKSEISSPINIVVSALSAPLAFLIPPVFPAGVDYKMQCETPLDGYINTTLSIYDRHIPDRAGNESFKYLTSAALNPGACCTRISRTNARGTLEYLCEMKVFFNGRTLISRSEPISDRPDELSVFLANTDKGTCHGTAHLKVRDEWRPLCFSSKFPVIASVANVVCRDLGCGHALDYTSFKNKDYNAVGTPNCTGTEKKVAECPVLSPGFCDKGTLQVICSVAFPAPKLKLDKHEVAPRVYVRTEETVTLECVFQSEADIVLIRNKQEIYSSRALPGYTLSWLLRAPVTEGEYACYIRAQSSSSYRTETSNIIGIYMLELYRSSMSSNPWDADLHGAGFVHRGIVMLDQVWFS